MRIDVAAVPGIADWSYVFHCGTRMSYVICHRLNPYAVRGTYESVGMLG